MISTHSIGALRPVAASVAKDPRAVQLGSWLMELRLQRGLTRPEAVTEALKHDPRAQLSSDYLSKLEYGNRSLASAAADVREAIRLGLNISREEWTQATGLLIPAPATGLRPAHSPEDMKGLKPYRPTVEVRHLGKVAAGRVGSVVYDLSLIHI